jgi:SAM-dependent methyltransferase
LKIVPRPIAAFSEKAIRCEPRPRERVVEPLAGLTFERESLSVDDEDLLAEQRSYYQARAPEYDEWWQRRGRFDRGDQELVEWQRQVAVVDDALTRFSATGSVLELAGGTGWWTERLARTADSLTVVDSSPEVLALNRTRVGRSDVNYVDADLFGWGPDSRYDVAFFSFWLSHVPRSRFSQFWSFLDSCLTPSGRAFLIDNRNDPQPETPVRDPFVIRHDTDLHLRRLRDGSEHRVVSVMYEPGELQSLIDAEGWSADIESTPWFIFGSARRT